MINLIGNKKVVLFVGCFANYYYSEVGKAVLKVLEHNGIEIVMPDQVCCGLPMMAKGNVRGADKNILYNSKKLTCHVAKG